MKAWIIAFAVLGMLVVSSFAWGNEERVDEEDHFMVHTLHLRACLLHHVLFNNLHHQW
jgi:hypothetical protein